MLKGHSLEEASKMAQGLIDNQWNFFQITKPNTHLPNSK
jgi:hypothetical protein